MTDVARDTWNDLRAKRLWPVAVVLVLAIVAIPFLLTSSAAKRTADSPLTAAPPREEERVTVELDGGDAASTGVGSSLDRFAEGDPFTPPAAIANRADAGATATASSTAGPSDSSTGSGSAGGGDSPSSGAPPSTDAPAPPVTRTESAAYEYVADVTFWSGDRRRSLRGLRKLDMLPNENAPVLIFMGTAGDGGNAVFLVDSTLRAAGEGRCVPGGGNCVYVHVGPGSEHSFTSETGESYRLRVEEIRKVRVQAEASRSAAVARPAAETASPRPFQLPSLTDVVVETTTTTTAGAEAAAEQAAAPKPRPERPAAPSSSAKDGR